MPNIRWQDLSDIRHNILNSLCKVTKAEEILKLLKVEIGKELDRYNDIIDRIGDCELTDNGLRRREEDNGN